MVTSLANFRSDYTIVHIPSGRYSDSRDRLFTNINLLRMGCSGRSALTLEEPSDTTKDRFMDMYHFQDKSLSDQTFDATVLELVRFVQAGLAICGMFDMAPEQRDGLLCDITVDGLQRWIAEIGEPCVGVEPMERVADPTVVSGLFSLVLTVRNQLCALKYHDFMPKDAFLDPQQFSYGFASFQQTPKGEFTPLTRSLVRAINSAYDKTRQLDSYKVHKVLLNKLDDLATDLRTTASGADRDTSSKITNHSAIVEPTLELDVFVQTILGGSKDGASSLRYLWTGRPGYASVRKKRKEKVVSDGEKDDADAERDPNAEDDDNEFAAGRPWSNRVQRKIEAWAGLSRSKRPNVDPSGKSKPADATVLNIPEVIVQSEDDDGLSSTAASPISASRKHFGQLGVSRDDISAIQSEYDRKVSEFNRLRPSTKAGYQSRVSSWSDPVSARGIVNDDPRPKKRSRLGEVAMDADEEQENSDVPLILVDDASVDSRDARKRLLVHGAKRRRSFDDVDRLGDIRILPMDRMRIDVELCGQLLVMRRREEHLRNVVGCLQILTKRLARTNAALREDYEAHIDQIRELEARMDLVADVEQQRGRADEMLQETNALCYESEQFRVLDLWHTADPPRQKVLALREKVFGTGRRARGVRGRFNRVQWTLDGRGRLVDRTGRTESDVEEEGGLPETVPGEEEEESVAESPWLGPTWLLRLFNSGPARWIRESNTKQPSAGKEEDVKADAKAEVSMQEPAVEPS
ncbi:hypothetical protein PUNSTDRAFT_84841 [Punctularia strigosozonata HHB-11173 SS5]|uniref:uncharacterized protein n=1 Tax=Punctularia strigosozonata (strain HHB-11173) TaxID=741275 RepID=UPI0004418737|nr:uncharacterized protein PUNSTDRAFT_84841 [Punctularia strigosozonata HHB-11173 SS5]EIN10634.1 hypothetical protein PUNSTDRAFT_84841 [Punctularia strigosozonata HHB-11173 SS5]